MHEGIAQLAELDPNCFRQPNQPLKIGIHNDIIARHPELQPGLIASALRTYTRSVGYLETRKSGAARIDLEGNPVGTVTAADEADAERKIARAARRAAAKAIEGRPENVPSLSLTPADTSEDGDTANLVAYFATISPTDAYRQSMRSADIGTTMWLIRAATCARFDHIRGANHSCRPLNLNVSPVSISTARPFTLGGLNFHWRSASSMLLRCSSDEWITWICFTIPSRSMMMRTGTGANLGPDASLGSTLRRIFSADA
jgi:ProQ/FINO family